MNAAALGSVSLWAAILTGLVVLVPRSGPRVGRIALRASAALAALSTTVLAFALVGGNFSLAYVAQTTSRATPWPYRLSALWGGMNGSMLFYATLTLAVGLVALRRARSVGVAHRVVALVGLAYLLITALAANPFATLDVPAVDGGGLLAILQHPAMVYHPPLLYLGLTSLVVPFALTVESLAVGAREAEWLTGVRRALGWSWTLLTIGMAAGASWAYVELGWGGFWAWDPVENTALMPWIAATVFFHTSRIQGRNGRLRRWNVFFAMVPFALSVLGVYLTRSGVTGSIHSFAEDPVIGKTLLIAALLAVGVSSIVAWRSPSGEPWPAVGLGRETWLAVSGALLGAALVFVTIGSAYPAYATVFFDQAVAVDSRFFVVTVYPIALAVAVLTPFALETRWSRAGISGRDLGPWVVTGAALWLGASWYMGPVSAAPVALVACAGAGAVDLVRRFARGRGSGPPLVAGLAHLGVVMLLLGAGGSGLGEDFTGVMAAGDVTEVGGHRFELLEISTGESDRYVFVRARFEMDEEIVLEPEIRAYEDQSLPVAEPVLHSAPGRDAIIAISRLAPDAETVSVSVFVRPMVWLVWAGALVMVAAGLTALYGRAGGVGWRRRGAREGRRRGGTTSDTFAG